ncbi:MAG TPA: hypothetical protein VJ753_05695 [Rhizomicrobium sp.]|nr:hypothetical protein [Rhizomicrobium sp.]
MVKRASKIASKKSGVLQAMKAESSDLGEQIAELMSRKVKLDDTIAVYEGKGPSQHSQRVIQQHRRLSQNSPFFGLGLPEAARLQLSHHTTPITPRELWDEMKGKYPSNSQDPVTALHWALRRREHRFGDVIMIGDGKWMMADLVPPEEQERIKASRGPMAGRDRANHTAKTKAGYEAARANGARWGAPLKMTDEKIAKLRQLIEHGLSIKEACQEVGCSTGTFTIYKQKGRFEGLKIPKKRKKGPAVDEPDLLSHSQSKGAIN